MSVGNNKSKDGPIRVHTNESDTHTVESNVRRWNFVTNINVNKLSFTLKRGTADKQEFNNSNRFKFSNSFTDKGENEKFWYRIESKRTKQSVVLSFNLARMLLNYNEQYHLAEPANMSRVDFETLNQWAEDSVNIYERERSQSPKRQTEYNQNESQWKGICANLVEDGKTFVFNLKAYAKSLRGEDEDEGWGDQA